MEIPEELAGFATRFEFVEDGITYTIERYDNHGRFLDDGAWCVACWFTKGDVPNVHYLGNGRWRYKNGSAYLGRRVGGISQLTEATMRDPYVHPGSPVGLNRVGIMPRGPLSRRNNVPLASERACEICGTASTAAPGVVDAAVSWG